jgi:hypothetical protein
MFPDGALDRRCPGALGTDARADISRQNPEVQAPQFPLGAFLRIAGASGVDDGPLPEAVASGVRRAHGGRLPARAVRPLEPIRAAAVPSLVASGDHTPGIERICDARPPL